MGAESLARRIWLTAIFQVIIIAIGGSAGLLADTIHNFADALTSLPLWLAFWLSRRPANRRFTYGYGRAEDVAGIIILLVIFSSAVLAGYESYRKLIRGAVPQNLDRLPKDTTLLRTCIMNCYITFPICTK